MPKGIKKSDKQLALFLAKSRDMEVMRGIIKSSPDTFIQFIGEIALNVLSGNVSISKHHKSKLAKSADIIRLLASGKVEVSRRRTLIMKNTKVVLSLINSVKSHL
jgi:hypothetical protein